MAFKREREDDTKTSSVFEVMTLDESREHIASFIEEKKREKKKREKEKKEKTKKGQRERRRRKGEKKRQR